jgi:hypothetical protein
MLNVKYVIQTDKEGKRVSNDWNQMQMVTLGFVNDVKLLIIRPIDEMKLLDHTIPKKQPLYLMYLYGAKI